MFNIKLNQFLIEKRTQRYHPLLSLTFSGLDSDRKIEKHVSSFYAKRAAWRIRYYFVTGQYVLLYESSTNTFCCMKVVHARFSLIKPLPVRFTL